MQRLPGGCAQQEGSGRIRVRGWGLVCTRGRGGQIRSGPRMGSVACMASRWALSSRSAPEPPPLRTSAIATDGDHRAPGLKRHHRGWQAATEADYCGRACPLPVFHLCCVPSSRRTPSGACLLWHGIWKTCRPGCGHVWYAWISENNVESSYLHATSSQASFYLFFWSVVDFYYRRRYELKQEFYGVCLNNCSSLH